jgi:hypothetical protein
MAHSGYQGSSPQLSMADEPSRLISDPRTQHAVSSITLKDGTTIQLNQRRMCCRTCGIAFANENTRSAHEMNCSDVCEAHRVTQAYSRLGLDSLESEQIAHVTNPQYTHSRCVFSMCGSQYRATDGWSNKEIVEHTIMTHSSLDEKEKFSYVQRIRNA